MESENALRNIDEIIVIPYCHTDFAWTNERAWHICRYLKSFEAALDIMRKDPDFTYGVDNVAHSLAAFVENRPERLAELRARVAEGRFYVANGGYSLARPDYIGDEAYLRNLIEGKRTLDALLSPRYEIDFFFNADTAVGHSQMPQILKLSGHRYYMFERPFAGLDAKKIPKQFRWKGLDGSDVVVSRGDYGGFLRGEYLNGDLSDWESVKKDYLKNDLGVLLRLSTAKTIAQFYGGDDFIPMNTVFDRPLRLSEFIAEWNKRERVKMRFGTPYDYFHAIEKEKLPVVRGVLDPGELSFNAPIKGNHSFWRKRLEANRLLPRLETLCVMAEALGISYPEQRIKALWRSLFEFTGHALEFILEEDHEKLFSFAEKTLLDIIAMIRDTAGAIAKKLAVGGESENIIINASPFDRFEPVTLHLTSAFGIGRFKLRDRFGNDVPYQITEAYTGDKAAFSLCAIDVAARVFVPAYSYNAVSVSENTPFLPERIDRTYHNHAGKAPRDHRKDFLLVNGAFAARFDNGALTGFSLPGLGEINAPRGLFHLEFTKTTPSGGWLSNWDAAERFAFTPESFTLLKNGPVTWEYRVSGTLGPHSAEVTFSAGQGEPSLRLDVKILSGGTEGYFTAGFDCADSPDIFADIPFGVEKRELSHEPNQGGKNAEAYPCFEQGAPGLFFANTFAAFKSGPLGLALISRDCSIYFRHEKKRNRVDLLLNRNIDISSPEKSDSFNDFWFLQASPAFSGRGEQNYSFALMPRRADTADLTDAVRESARVRRPLETVRVFNAGTGAELIPIINAANKNITVTAVYAEDGAHIVRFYEAAGKETDAEITINLPYSKIEKTDLLGRPLEELKADGKGKLILAVRPWEIVNLKLTR